MYDRFDGHDMFLNLLHERKKRIDDRVKYSMSNPSWRWSEPSDRRQDTMLAYQPTCEWFVQ
jgi:hypothetical protein